MLGIGSVVINVADVRRGVAFWCAALGYRPRRDVADDFAILVPVDGDGQRVSINLSDQAVPDGKRFSVIDTVTTAGEGS